MENDLNGSYVDGIEGLNLKVNPLDENVIDLDEIKERNLKLIEVDRFEEFDLKENHEDGIEDRMKHLVDVVFRARQHQRRKTLVENYYKALIMFTIGDNGRTIEDGKIGTKKSSYLVAKALGMERNTNENFYDCNLCFKKANGPVLTCCGHLFCWSCFYLLPSAPDSNAKECHVCVGEVYEEDLIPIYG